MKFEELKIGLSLVELEETVTGLTSNSVEVTRTRRTEAGVNCREWFALASEMDEKKFSKHSK